MASSSKCRRDPATRASSSVRAEARSRRLFARGYEDKARSSRSYSDTRGVFTSIPELVNLADLYRIQKKETEAQQFLEKAIVASTNAAEPIHALGLLKARLGRQKEALDLFARTADVQPRTTRYAYVYGVALHSYGEVDKAISVLKKAHDNARADRDVLMALITFLRNKGDVRSAAVYADKLVQLNPGDVQITALRNSLNQPQRSETGPKR